MRYHPTVFNRSGRPVRGVTTVSIKSGVAKPAAMSERLLIALAALAFLLRAFAVLFVASYHTADSAYEHAEIARALVAGQGFRAGFFGPPQPTSQQAPLTPLTLAAAYWLFGPDSPAAHLAWQLLAALLGAAACVVVALIGTRLARPAVGTLAALATAFYPPLIYCPTRIQAVNFAVPALLALVWLALRCRDQPTLRRAALFGAFGGLSILAEPILAAPLATLATWLTWSLWKVHRSTTHHSPLTTHHSLPTTHHSPLTLLLVPTAAALLVLAPWTLRNYHVHHRLVLVKSSFGYCLWQGNNPAATGTDKLLPASQDLSAFRSTLDPRSEESQVNRLRHRAGSIDETLPDGFIAPTEIERDDMFRARAYQWIRAHPLDYIRLCLRRLYFLAWFDPTNPRSYSTYYRAPYVTLLALAVAGTLLSLRRSSLPLSTLNPQLSTWPPLSTLNSPLSTCRTWAPLYLAFAAQITVHTLIITSARFRLPLEACLTLPAALTLASLAARLARLGSAHVLDRIRPADPVKVFCRSPQRMPLALRAGKRFPEKPSLGP